MKLSQTIHFVMLGLLVSTVILLSGCVRLTDEGGRVLNIGQDEAGFYIDKAGVVDLSLAMPKQLLKAQVKGSIYETGEYMSVFGACLTSEDQGAADSYALFSGWYPNGTQFIFNNSMQQLQTGYFLYQGTMSAVEGTYLTEMRCFINNTNMTAVAFGEWQNPYWVRRIALLNDSMANLSVQVSNLSVQIGDLQVNISNSFNITWDKLDTMNYTMGNMYANLTNLTYYVAMVANSSVDRNDSLLALLLYNLTSLVTPVNLTGVPVPYEETADTVVFYKDWQIRVQAYDGVITKKLQYPDVQCYINTTLTPTPVAMTPYGTLFKFNEFITITSLYSWTVNCYWT